MGRLEVKDMGNVTDHLTLGIFSLHVDEDMLGDGIGGGGRGVSQAGVGDKGVSRVKEDVISVLL